MDPVRVVVADDLEDVRYWFRMLLEEAGLCEVVGEAATGGEVVEVVGRLQPDVVVLDLVMPEMSGLEAIPLIKVVSPRTKVVAVTGMGKQSEHAAYEAGAVAFVTKDAKPGELVDAVANAAGRPAPG